MAIVCVANQKGGVGKTTSAVTLAAGAARRGYKVLLIDLDSQGNVADSLGMDAGGELTMWLVQDMDIWRVAVQARENLDVIRADKTTANLKIMLSGMDFREYTLMNALGKYEYDLVIMDCAPSVDVLHTAALVAADYLIIPTKLDQFAIKGVRESLRSLQAVQHASRSKCQLAGVLPTFYDRVTKESQAQLVNLSEAFRGLVWPVIPQDVNCREANRMGKTLYEYDAKSRAIRGVEETGRLAGGYDAALFRLCMYL